MNESQDIVTEARRRIVEGCSCGVCLTLRLLADEVERLRKVVDIPPNERSVCDCHTWPTVSELHDYTVALESKLKHLADEVERLREQWNTRFNTLCGLCGKRYLGPRDEHLHGFGKCDKEVSNA